MTFPSYDMTPFTANDAPADFQAAGEKRARNWARHANSLYAGFTNPKGRNLAHDVAMEKAARQATAEAGRARRFA